MGGVRLLYGDLAGGAAGIPNELYDAAKVDGANGWRLHRYVTVPLLRPTAAFIIVISTIGAANFWVDLYFNGWWPRQRHHNRGLPDLQ
ncbi:MAG: ABC transporter permease subunit [Caldilineaceae bacterium]